MNQSEQSLTLQLEQQPLKPAAAAGKQHNCQNCVHHDHQLQLSCHLLVLLLLVLLPLVHRHSQLHLQLLLLLLAAPTLTASWWLVPQA
jgi:hypothetical protein